MSDKEIFEAVKKALHDDLMQNPSTWNIDQAAHAAIKAYKSARTAALENRDIPATENGDSMGYQASERAAVRPKQVDELTDERMAEIVAKATEPNLWEHTHKPDSDGYWKNTARKKKVLRRARIAVSALRPYLSPTAKGDL